MQESGVECTALKEVEPDASNSGVALELPDGLMDFVELGITSPFSSLVNS